jgi:hypothetical protein
MGYRDVLDQRTIEDYGPDFLEVVDKVAAGRTRQLEGQVAHLQGQLARQGRRDMMAYLDASVPGWRETNDSQDFIAYLDNTTDPYSGRNLRTLLQEAWNATDAARVARFFRDFSGQQRHAPAPRTGTLTLSKDGTHYYRSDNGPGPLLTRAQIAAHYSDCTRRKDYYQTEEGKRQKAEFEALLERANREGRIA